MSGQSVEARAIRVLRGFCDADEVDMILEGLRPLLVGDDTERLVALGRACEDWCEMDATCADGVIPKPVLERMQAIRSAAGVPAVSAAGHRTGCVCVTCEDDRLVEVRTLRARVTELEADNDLLKARELIAAGLRYREAWRAVESLRLAPRQLGRSSARDAMYAAETAFAEAADAVLAERAEAAPSQPEGNDR